jgi:hypothetical protein
MRTKAELFAHLAALLEAQAEVYRELAEVEGGEAPERARPVPSAPTPAARPRAAPRQSPPPAAKPDDITAARARRGLKQLGYRDRSAGNGE